MRKKRWKARGRGRGRGGERGTEGLVLGTEEVANLPFPFNVKYGNEHLVFQTCNIGILYDYCVSGPSKIFDTLARNVFKFSLILNMLTIHIIAPYIF